jgi:hypothetical protein
MRKLAASLAVAAALVAPVALAVPAQAALKPPVGTCGSSEGCGCGGVYVLKYKYILAYC